jgi:hypothetical protein
MLSKNERKKINKNKTHPTILAQILLKNCPKMKCEKKKVYDRAAFWHW